MLSVHDQRPAHITVEGHLTLSATINWHLAARKVDLRALLRVILGPAKVTNQDTLLEALNYLHHAYGDRRRKNGPAAVLHCLRIAAVLARIMPAPTTLDLLGALLHDKEEDLTREELGAAEWDRLQAEFSRVLDKIDSNHRWFLGERIALLWRQTSQSYYQYLGVILSKARAMPDLLRCKLADRLDNTLDIAVQRAPIEQNAFFELAFRTMFLAGYQPVSDDGGVAPDMEACVLLVSQLFKNVVLMSMLRQHHLDTRDDRSAVPCPGHHEQRTSAVGGGGVAFRPGVVLARTAKPVAGNDGLLRGGRHGRGVSQRQGWAARRKLLGTLCSPR